MSRSPMRKATSFQVGSLVHRRTATPDDGEDPEIISVVMLGGFEEHDITETLTGAEIEELVQVCINHQADSEGYAAEEAAEEAYSAWKEDRDLDY